jgi:hypothetical protein
MVATIDFNIPSNSKCAKSYLKKIESQLKKLSNDTSLNWDACSKDKIPLLHVNLLILNTFVDRKTEANLKSFEEILNEIKVITKEFYCLNIMTGKSSKYYTVIDDILVDIELFLDFRRISSVG